MSNDIERRAPPPVFKHGSEMSEARRIEDQEEEADYVDGRPRHQPTTDTITAVMLLSAFGKSQLEIANYIGLKTPKTLMRHYREHIEKAETMLDATVIGAWMKNVQEGKEMTVLRYMERKFLKPDTSHIPFVAPPEEVELTKERMRQIMQEIEDEC